MYFQDGKIEQLLVASEVIVFDLNGLIIDDEPIQLEATNAALACLNLQVDETYWIKNCVGHKPREFLTDLLSQKSRELFVLDDLLRQKEENYSHLIVDRVGELVREGVLDLIDYIKQHLSSNLALATSTTTEGVELILGQQGLNLYHAFDFIICGDQVTNSKPDPQIYNRVKEHFGNHKSYLVFEDSQAGVRAASLAQMHCVAVPNRYTAKQDFSAAVLVMTDFTKAHT